jgi:hypothetical protein
MAIADVCETEGLWLHADAAYGGFFTLTEKGRALFDGIARADSITLDPHKALFLPYGTGVLLVRDGSLLREAHRAKGDYLQDLAREGEIPNFTDYSPELSRDFRGLRVWLPLKLHGLNAFREALEEKLDLTRVLYEALRSTPGFDVPWEPEVTVVPFRYVPASGDVDGFNRRLLERINASKRIFLSSTRLKATSGSAPVSSAIGRIATGSTKRSRSSRTRHARSITLDLDGRVLREVRLGWDLSNATFGCCSQSRIERRSLDFLGGARKVDLEANFPGVGLIDARAEALEQLSDRMVLCQCFTDEMLDPVRERRRSEQLEQDQAGAAPLIPVDDDDGRFGRGRIVAHPNVARDSDPVIRVCIQADPREVVDVVDLGEVSEERRPQLVHIAEETPEARFR